MLVNDEEPAATANGETKEEAFQETGIYDCRGKEKVLVKRVGEDIAIRIVDESGKTVFESWFRLKKPAKANYAKISQYLKKVSLLLISSSNKSASDCS
jgi:hypothetical protein